MLFYPKEISSYYNALRKLSITLSSNLNNSSFCINELFPEVVSKNFLDPNLIYKLGENKEERRFIHEIYMYKKAKSRLLRLQKQIADYPERIKRGNITQINVDKTKWYDDKELKRFEKEIQEYFSNISTNNPHVVEYEELEPMFLKHLVGPQGVDIIDNDFISNHFGFIKVLVYKLKFVDKEEIIYENESNQFKLINDKLVENLYESEEQYEQDVYTYLSVVEKEEYEKNKHLSLR